MRRRSLLCAVRARAFSAVDVGVVVEVLLVLIFCFSLKLRVDLARERIGAERSSEEEDVALGTCAKAGKIVETAQRKGPPVFLERRTHTLMHHQRRQGRDTHRVHESRIKG